MDSSECTNSGLTPMLLPIRGNVVSDNGLAKARGIGITIGEPPQPFSLSPTVQQNNTFITNAVQCQSQKNYACVAEHGGIFNAAGARFTNNEGSWNGTPGETISGITVSFYNELFDINGQRVYGVPFFTYIRDQSTGTF